MKKDANKMNLPEYRTSDIQIAAFLLGRDFPLIRVEGNSPRTDFIFTNIPQEIIQEYYGGDCSECGINPRKLFGAFRDLKGLLVRQGGRQR